MAPDPQAPTDPPTQQPTKRQNAAQDKRMAKMLGLSGQQIHAGQTEIANAPLQTGTPSPDDPPLPPAIADLLAEGGFTALEMDHGYSLHHLADTAFAFRQTADGAEEAALATLHTADKTARKAYGKLREFARAAFPRNPAARESLGFSLPIPEDYKQFIDFVGRFVEACTNTDPAYVAKLAAKGVTAAKLQDLTTKVDALADAYKAHQDAHAAVGLATKDRNAKVDALTTWLLGYRGFIKAQFKGQPDILERLFF